VQAEHLLLHFDGEGRSEIMRCKDIMSKEIQWIPDACSASQAARLMAMHRVDLLPICGPDAQVLGVITDRDIVVRVVAKGRIPDLTRVDDVMSSPGEFVPPDCPVQRAFELMSKEGVSQLLVLGEDERLEGIIGLHDILFHAPEACTMEAIRGILAWRTGDATSRSRAALARDVETPGAGEGKAHVDNPARVEAETVVSDGANDLKEFPG
jgi:CBS domain-containing protein